MTRVYACEVEAGDRLMSGTVVEPYGDWLTRDETVRRVWSDELDTTIVTDRGRYIVPRGRLLGVICR